MRILPFKSSSEVSIGIELEFQIINPKTFDLVSRAKDLIRSIKERSFQQRIKPEITQSMIEINSSIHQNPEDLLNELVELRDFLREHGQSIGITYSGGGTHPFQKWKLQKFFPAKRYKRISEQYRYLSRRATVFGQHVHVGCKSGEDALYLTHAMSRYVPQLIAISAASPFYQGVDTGYFSSRSNDFSAFPTSGVIPYIMSWAEFSSFFYKMKNLGIVSSMKDFYWDVRPKPEFGTVEIRVCDTPLTLKKATIIAAYIQSLAHYLLQERPFQVTGDFYYLYRYNRFQAARYGYEGRFINPINLENVMLLDDILHTLKKIEQHANYLKNMGYVAQLVEEVANKRNDATLQRLIYQDTGSLVQVVQAQCELWEKG